MDLKNLKKTPIPQNYKNNVDWILGAYSDAGISFPNGFQKDAIQNSVGARKTNKFDNFLCDISVVKTSKGTYVVVEDSGTVGLTGRNISSEDLYHMMARNVKLPSEDRLARFTSMFNSGDNKTGGGLYGAGKSVYSIASKTYIYYFDSLREDGKYVANVNYSGSVLPLALEEDPAKAYILENTGLEEKKTIGTRIIIQDPIDELVESIDSKEILRFIQESWWLILQRLSDNSKISINRNPVVVPASIKTTPQKFELSAPETVAPGFRVKHFGLYVFEKGNSIWKGISYYRKGMKIGDIDLKDIPDKIEGKYWGYIEVDEEWEEALSEIEDKVHFGVSKGKKGTASYQRLKNFCQERVRANLIDWGYIKDKENEDKKLNNELKNIAEDLQDLFDKLKFEDLGKGPQKPDFDIRWQDIIFPIEGTERVSSGDTLTFSARIKSSYSTDKKFEYKLYIRDPLTNEIIQEITKDVVKVFSNTVEILEFKHTVTEQNSVHEAENKIILEVLAIGSGKKKVKELSYFYDIDRPDNSRDLVKLVLHECTFPYEQSRRVNFGDSLKNISYLLENKRNQTLKYRVNVSIHNAEDSTCPKIIDIQSFQGEAKPFEEIITDYIPEIVIEQSIFEQYLSSGLLELRARVIAAGEDEEFEKGDKITFYHFKLFLNCDEKHGKNDSFNTKGLDDPKNYRRSWFQTGPERTIFLNYGHTAYLNVKDYEDLQHGYLKEQMLKQYVCLYLAEGKYDMFGAKEKDFMEYEPQEAADKVIEKIEWIYNESLR